MSDKTTEPKKPKSGPTKFGTFQGVFTPTLLTILGVIMYLRAGWVVGNAGLVGSIAIITLATAITLFTTLSMSSITTNIRIKAGGAFSIISQSLGLEAGGAIGIPLYFAQAFAVAMYIFGFREGWQWLFPEHNVLLIDLITFVVILLIAGISTDFAFKIQYFIMVIIVLSVISVILGFVNMPLNENVQLIGDFPGAKETGFGGMSFWMVFAVYFPAVTGIMAGANMSGDLKNPRKSIPVGTLAALGLSYVVYIAVAVMLAFMATPEELLNNYNVLIDKSFSPLLVVLGLLGATFSSALSSIVGAPRILYALAQNKILFCNDIITKTDKKGEPRNALLITAVIVFLSLLMRDLNAIAPLLTMFFMITYAMINVVVLVEQSLEQVSFRPTFRIPIVISLLGALGCFFVMFIINPTVSIVSMVLVVFMYKFLMTQNLRTEKGDTRSGVFGAMAEWAAKIVQRLPKANERAWQPNLLVPAERINDVVRCYKAIYTLARPKGSIKILGFPSRGRDQLKQRIKEMCKFFMENQMSANWAIVDSKDYRSGIMTSMQCLKASFFNPNTLFLSLTDDKKRDEDIAYLLEQAAEQDMGAYLYIPYKKVGLGLEKTINFWLDLRERERMTDYELQDINLGLLTAYLLKRNWKGKLNIVTLMNGEKNQSNERQSVKRYIDKLTELARLPRDTKIIYASGDMTEVVASLPHVDLNIMVLKRDSIDIASLREQVNMLETTCLYTIDGGEVNALA